MLLWMLRTGEGDRMLWLSLWKSSLYISSSMSPSPALGDLYLSYIPAGFSVGVLRSSEMLLVPDLTLAILGESRALVGS